MKFFRLTRAAHPNHAVYQYAMGYRFDPGAMAEVFEPNLSNPVLSFRGRARIAGEMRVTQQPQVWFTQQIGVNGLGGVQTGQVAFQPLIDPATLKGSGG